MTIDKTLTGKYALINSSFYLIYAIMWGYAALYLQAKGFTNTEIGVIFAVAAAGSILLQFWLGPFLDRHVRLSAKHVIFALHLVMTLSVLAMLLAPSHAVTTFSYTIIMTILLVDAALFNTFGMEFINAGLTLDFSLCRGLGSLAYSIASLLTGFLVQRAGADSILTAFFLIQGVSYLTLLFLTPVERPTAREDIPEQQPDTVSQLFHKRPALLLLLTSILLMYLSYTAINNFHINIIESVGGGSRELGISTAIAAFVELPVMAAFLRLARRFSYGNMLRFSCAFFVIKVLLTAFAASVPAVYAAQCLQLLSYGLFIPASTYYINAVLGPANIAKGQTLLGIFTFGLSGLISGAMSGVLLEHFSVRTTLLIYTVLAATGFSGLLLAMRRVDKAPRSA